MTPSGSTNAEARMLLKTLCKFIIPLIQMAVGQTTMDANQIPFGIEADDFVIELEIFISGIISRSQPRRQDVIEATLGKHWFDYMEDEEATTRMRGDSNDEVNPERVPSDHDESMPVQYPAIPQSIPPSFNEEDLVESALQHLREHITQKMPIRLLCFEPHNSKLNISLLERADIYNYLAPKVRADFSKESPFFYRVEGQARYAILSHTWNLTPGEVTYNDWQKGPLDDNQPKYRKLINFCNAAWEDYGLTLGWIDTVCINKESSTELDESIRSMYSWYSNAEVCITYLAATSTVLDMHDDPWFTRGWTLQELVAPQCLKFYTMYWNQLSSKSPYTDKYDFLIQNEIRLATTITPEELQSILTASISRRMQLAAKRQVTRSEDIAYCLMGIFDVSISTAYGEGADRAFFRLVEEIFRSTKDVSDIFNWAGSHEPSHRQPITSLFPSHPSDYLNRSSNEQLRPWRPIEPLTLTHLGLRIPVLMMPAVPIRASVLDHQPLAFGDYQATAFISGFYFDNDLLQNYQLLDKKAFGPTGLYQREGINITLTFGTLNIEEQISHIHVPKTCLAVLLTRPEYETREIYTKQATEYPVVFDLEKISNNSDDEQKVYYHVERRELARHAWIIGNVETGAMRAWLESIYVRLVGEVQAKAMIARV